MRGARQHPVVQIQVTRPTAAPVERGGARDALELHVLDQRLDGRKPGARCQQHDGLGRILAQEKAAKRALDAQDFLFLQGAEHMVGELAARHVANVQLQPRGLGLRVGGVGHGIGAAHATLQQELDVLARVVAEGVGRGQLQAQLHDIVRFFLEGNHAHGHLLDGEGAFVGDLARFEHHVGQGVGAAGQHKTCGFFVGRQGFGLVFAMVHGAADFFALARTAGAVLAAIGQPHAAADGRRQDGFVCVGTECAAAGLHGDLERCVGRLCAGHGVGILGLFFKLSSCERPRFCP